MMPSGPVANPTMMSGGVISNNPNLMPQGSMSNNPNMMPQGPMSSNSMMSGPNTASLMTKAVKSDSVSCLDPFQDEPNFSRQQRQQPSGATSQPGMPPHPTSMPPHSSSFSSYNRPNMPPQQQNFPNVSQPNT